MGDEHSIFPSQKKTERYDQNAPDNPSKVKTNGDGSFQRIHRLENRGGQQSNRENNQRKADSKNHDGLREACEGRNGLMGDREGKT
ncbi:MAG: hypothetical protein GWQ05_01625 [Verrucomicrobiaceae bacterium]|nr:hypothetical protein [Verrucomicrobiaceae bacterium]